MASRLVYTAITKGHAQLSVRPEMPDTDFVCFSDVPLDRSDWDVRPIEAPLDLSPRMRAKFHKLFPPDGYEWSVWMDGSHVLSTSTSPSRMMDALILVSPGGLGLHKHPRIDCIYDEGKDVLSLEKVRGQPIEAQVQHYRERGHPPNWGLWACGSICRNHRSTRVKGAMRMWWEEMLRWSDRDQISFAFVMRSLGLRPDEWPWKLYENPHFSAIHHNWSA